MSELMPYIEFFGQYGLLGAVLAWFMWRNEKVMTRLIDKIELLCREIEPKKYIIQK